MTIQLKNPGWGVCVLVIAAGCIRTAKTTAPPWKAPCLLYRGSGPARPEYDDTERAVADFQNSVGNQYSALYIEKTAGSSRGLCIRVRQRAGALFEVYRYKNDIVDSARLNSPALSLAFARIKKGHYSPICRNFISETTTSVLLAKAGQETLYSLVWEPQQWEHMEDSIQVQLTAGRELQNQISQAAK